MFMVGVSQANGDLDSSESDVDSGESEPAPSEFSSLTALSASEIRTPVTWLTCHMIPSSCHQNVGCRDMVYVYKRSCFQARAPLPLPDMTPAKVPSGSRLAYLGMIYAQANVSC